MNTALLVIDVQVGIVQEAFKAAETVSRMRQLIDGARQSGVPVIYVQHDDPAGHGLLLEPGVPTWEIDPSVGPGPGEAVFRKTACDSFYETPLHEHVRGLGVHHLVVVGAMTQYCIDTTCRRAVTLGYAVTLVADGHLTSDGGPLPAEQIIAHHNAILNGFGTLTHEITVKPTEAVRFAG